MKKLISLSAIPALLLCLAGCAAFQPDPAERIIGTWQTRVGGFPVTVTYAQNTVQVANNPAVRYRLEGDRLRFESGGSQSRVIAFPHRDEMVQTDPMTGTSHRYVRIEEDR